MDVSVIIVNYNTCKLLDECLHSVFEQTTGLEFEVIVSDNQSVDGSAEMVAHKYSRVIWIQNQENLGFGRANNKGLEIASGKYVFLLNSDTILLNNAILLFYDYMEKQSGNVGVAGCRLVDAQGKTAISSGEFPSALSDIRYMAGRIFRRKQAGQLVSESATEVDFVSGADMFIPASVLRETGFFDEQFFMYFEETDLQKRMQLKGYKRVLIPGPAIVHLEGGSLEQPQTLTFRRLCMNLESFRKYRNKHFRGMEYLVYRIVSVLVRMTLLIDRRFTFEEKKKAMQLLLK